MNPSRPLRAIARALMLMLAFWSVAAEPISAATAPRLKLRLHRAVAEAVPGDTTNASLTVASWGRQPIGYNLDGSENATVQAWLAAIPEGNDVTIAATGLDSPVQAVYGRSATLPDLNGPDDGWTGAANSGFGAWTDCDGVAQTGFPTNPNTTSQRPVGRFRVVPRQRLTDGAVLTVIADGYAPIASVDIIGEGGCTRLTQQTVHSYRDSYGRWQFVAGYHARLRTASWLAQSPTGTANFVAKITSTDGAFTYAIVGRETSDGSAAQTAEQMLVLPRAAEYSLRINVDPSITGDCELLNEPATWPTPRAVCKDPDFAMSLARGDTVNGVTRGVTSDVAPEVVVVASMTWSPKTWGYSGATGADAVVTDLGASGWPTIRAASGVTLTIRRTTWDDTSRDTLFWQPKLAPLRLQGANVVHDQTNGAMIRSFNTGANEKLIWYDGITVPIGDVDPRIYLRPDGQAYPNSVPKIVTGGDYPRGLSVITNTANTSTFTQGSSLLVWDAVSDFTTGDMTNGARVFDNVVANRLNNYGTFRDQINALRIWYDGGDATATVTKHQNEGDESTSARFSLTSTSGTTTINIYNKRNIEEVVDEINTYAASGWHAELCTAGASCAGVTPLVLNDRLTDRHPVYLTNFAATNAKGAGVTATTRVDIHSDFHQFTNGSTTREQRIVRNLRGLEWDAVQMGKMDGTNVTQDMAFVNIAVKPRDGDSFSTVTASYDVASIHRQILIKNWADLGSSWRITTYAGTLDPSNLFTSVVVRNIQWDGTPTATPIMRDVVSRTFGANVQSAISNKVVLDNTLSHTRLFPGYASNDWTPANELVSAGNLKAPEANTPFDLEGQLFRPLDAIGPRAMRVTSETIAKANALDVAILTRGAANDNNAGTLTLTTRAGAGNTGAVKVLQLSVAVQ